MIVWGGHPMGSGGGRNTGGLYDAGTDTWEPTEDNGALPAARGSHTAVWTGTEMIVWGGRGQGLSGLLATGGVYDPASNRWDATSLASAPARAWDHTTVWTGRR